MPYIVPLLLLALALVTGPDRADAAAPQDPWTLCARAVGDAERAAGIPEHLLQAIALAESGRTSKAHRARLAWPWTVMAERRGRYLPSKAAAIAEVKDLQARGVRNIDVGCMQVNMKYHPNAFDGLDEAFDPSANTAYAARFLRDLKRETGSWTAAAGRYHSATPKYNRPYRAKIARIWRKHAPRIAELAGAGTRPDSGGTGKIVQVADASASAPVVADAPGNAIVKVAAPPRSEPAAAASAEAKAHQANVERERSRRRTIVLRPTPRRHATAPSRLLFGSGQSTYVRDAKAEAQFEARRRQQLAAWRESTQRLASGARFQ